MDGNSKIIGGEAIARGECDASELLVVEFEGVASLLDLPVADSGMGGDFRINPLQIKKNLRHSKVRSGNAPCYF